MATMPVNTLLKIGTVLASAGAVAFLTMAFLGPQLRHQVVLEAPQADTWFPRRAARAEAAADNYRSGGFDETLALLLARAIDGSAPRPGAPMPNIVPE